MRADSRSQRQAGFAAVLRSALSEAKRLHIVPRNAAMDVHDPKRTKKVVTPLTVEQARLLLAQADAHRLKAFFLRSGEVVKIALVCQVVRQRVIEPADPSSEFALFLGSLWSRRSDSN